MLHGINFKLAAGETLVVIGPSGAGKTTLARCLVNAWPPLRGKVRLDSAPLDQWRPEALGALIGYLPQDVQLFAGTVAENIARFGEVNEAKVIAAAQMAGVHELILQLPEGYQTRLGENGVGLSGGQRQRVAWHAPCTGSRAWWCWTNPTPTSTKPATPCWPRPLDASSGPASRWC